MNDILVVGLIAIILYDIQIVKPFGTLNKDYLSLESCASFRGIFALVVIFHHLAQRTSGGVLFHLFSYVGHLAVAVFFFYSGYGLMKKHMSSPQYYEKFLLNRIPSILFPYLVITAVYWLYYAGTGEVYNFKQVMVSTFVTGFPIIPYSWYVIVILLFYVAFWLLMTLFKERYTLMMIGACLLQLIYILFCDRFHYGIWWYNSAFTFVVGMFWAYKESDILALLEKNFLISAIAVISLGAVCFWGTFFVEREMILLALQITSACLFCIIVVMFSMKFTIRGKVAHFFGTISLELYLIQGLPIMLLQNMERLIPNELLWCLVTLSLSVVLAAAFHVLFTKMLTYYQNVFIK